MKFSKNRNRINKYLALKFNELGYMPRWAILIIDIFIILLACFITTFLVFSFNSNYYKTLNLFVINFLIVFTNSIFFILYNTYTGVIRHSTFIDGLKLFISTITSFTLLSVFNYTWQYYHNGNKFFITSGIFIVHVLIFILLLLFRILIKKIYEVFLKINTKSEKTNIVIYGANNNAVAVANAIKSENPSRFNPVGFIDHHNKVKGTKTILNLPVYNQNLGIYSVVKTLHAETIIIAEKKLTNNETIAVVDVCLENNIKVYAVPTITNWEDYQQISTKMKKFEIVDLLDRSPIILDTKAIASKLNHKIILITGAAGSIGSEIVRQLLNFNPQKIVPLDQAETALNSLKIEIENLKESIEVVTVLANIIDYSSVEKVFEKHQPHVIYHAAAYKHVPMMEENPSQAVFTNILGTKNIADLSEKYRAERFVMVSTDKAVNPSSVMGASKRIAEMYIQSKYFHNQKKYNSNSTIFITTRFGNVLGSNGSVVPLFTKQIANGGPVTITHPDIIRYFMTIPEACQLVLEACSMGNGGETFIFDMGKPVKIIDLAKKMIRLAGYTPNVDILIKTIGLRPGEKLFEELLHDNAKNLPTHHKKITIAVEQTDHFEIINQDIEKLIELSKSKSKNDIVSFMKKMVPEFVSMNSTFDNLNSVNKN